MNYPMHFKVSAQANSGIQTKWQTASREGEIAAAIPPEFSGPGKGQSPEDFYALAVLNCFVATFKVIAEKSNLSYSRLETEGDLEVDLNEQKRPWMARMKITAKLYSPSDAEKAHRLLDKATHQCLIHNSIKTAVTFEFAIE
jgi:organic hydroperoxide reductase OsmC/OhrA